MAAANHGAAAAALLIASLLVAVTLAEARLTMHHDTLIGGYAVGAVKAALSCSRVKGVQAGETCFSIAQAVGLTQDEFLTFNPNINCQAMFVGQWVCLLATGA